ncbi:MAG: GyrI-like domain-containing protein [Defluviitaleaceae bacterium]|nr:GyrI-like domain-containing protein [Defluviitaleaceae bacterium]MCL2240110.1 GyrI-like domain-containing protein [Defluviitaleaceae bacterium]
MTEIIKTYRQSVDAARFIGKKYSHADFEGSSIFEKWGEWFRAGWFDQLEKLGDVGEGQIGLIRTYDGVHEYYIGYFMPEGTAAPEGFIHVDFPAGELGVCWVRGKDGEVYGQEGRCLEKLAESGITVSGGWSFERYNCPRFTTPDEKGHIILDVCFFL